MRPRALVALTTALTLGICGLADARSYSLSPSKRDGSTQVFGLSALKGKQSKIVRAVLRAGSTRKFVKVETVRAAVAKGSIRVFIPKRMRGRGSVRLVVRVDTKRPTKPKDVGSTAGAGAVTLLWRPASDNDRVKSYRIQRDGATIAEVPADARTYVDATATPGKRHRYTIHAVDRANNTSTSSKPTYATPSAPAPAAPATPAQPTGGPSPSGEGPVASIPGWQLVFADDFTRNIATGDFPDGVTWGAYDQSNDTSGNGRYDPWDTISVHDGVMDKFVRREGSGQALVAAPFPRISNQTYGRYAVRFRADPTPGFKVAWLLWPASENWPADGEIDFPEGDLNGRIAAFMHRLGASSGSDQDAFSTNAVFSTWHTTVLEWTAGAVRFYLDGQLIGQSTQRIPNRPMRWVLQTETSLGSQPAPGAQSHVLIDWVTVHRPG
jgi:hypothetical protein